MTICGLFSIATPCPFCIFLVGFGMYFIHTVKANAHVLPRIDEMNKLFYRAIKLPNNVLHRQHHTKGHIALYDRGGCQNCDKDILHLIYGDASCLLHLLQVQSLKIDFEQVCLHILPLPTFALFASLQLDFLHTVYKLVSDVAVSPCLLKEFVVKQSALFKKEDYPPCVKQCSKEKNSKNTKIIEHKDYTEDKKCKK